MTATPLGAARALLEAARLRRWRRRLDPIPRPRHVGIIMDGNRRWARTMGLADPSLGHRAGAEHIEDVLRWAEHWDVHHVTLFVLSADNIRKRSSVEVGYLFELRELVPEAIMRSHQWALHVSGDPRMLPGPTLAALTEATRRTAARPRHVTMAIGYDAHHDIITGMRAALRELVDSGRDPHLIEIDDITHALPGGPSKEIDLVIRTGGDTRISGFFPWQASHAEIFFTSQGWPAFTELDFARALAHYARNRLAGLGSLPGRRQASDAR